MDSSAPFGKALVGGIFLAIGVAAAVAFFAGFSLGFLAVWWLS